MQEKLEKIFPNFSLIFCKSRKGNKRFGTLRFFEDEDLEDDADEDEFEPGMDMSTLLGFYPR